MGDNTSSNETEINDASTSESAKILNEILDPPHSESLPSTCKSDSTLPLANDNKPQPETISTSSNHSSISKLQEGDSVRDSTNSNPKINSEDKTKLTCDKPQQEAISVSYNDSLDSKLQKEDDAIKDTNNPSAKAINDENKIPFGTCTVKEILHEILDCTVVRRPSMVPSTSQRNERNLIEPLPELVLNPELIPRHLFVSIRTGSEENARSRMQYTIKEVLNEILDYTVFKKSAQSNSYRSTNVSEFNRASTSHTGPEFLLQGDPASTQREYKVYRAMGANVMRSASAPQGETFYQRSSLKSLGRILPSYSTVIKLGPPPRIKSFHSSGSFIPRIPPPSYSEVEGLFEDNPSMISSESVVFGPDPTYVVCPRCRTVVVTEVQTERSNMTHLIALVMCLFLCWPCCLLPYCLRSCNYSYHSCPNCGHYFGMYRPF